MAAAIESLHKKSTEVLVSEMNAAALAANLADIRMTYDKRLIALENETKALRTLVQNQSRVIGEALQRTMGSGSTEPSDE